MTTAGWEALRIAQRLIGYTAFVTFPASLWRRLGSGNVSWICPEKELHYAP